MKMNEIGLYILYIIVILFGPILLMFPIWTKLLKNKYGPQKILILHIGKTKIVSTQKILVTSLLTIAFLFCLDYILPIPFSTFILIFILSAVISNKLEIVDKGDFLATDSNQLKKELKDSLDKIKASISSIESLAVELETKSIELTEKGSHSKQLDKDIETKLNEYESWKKLSEEEKQLFISAVDKTVNKKGTINFIVIVIGSIALNLAANLIWSLMGNPDKPTLLDFLKYVFGIK